MSGKVQLKVEICRTCPEPITAARAAGGGQCKRCYMREYNKVYKPSRSDDYRDNQRTWVLQHKYQITPEDYDAQEAYQRGLCAICGKVQMVSDGRRMAVDHDHKCCPGKRTLRCVPARSPLLEL